MVKAKQRFTRSEKLDNDAGAFICPFEKYKYDRKGNKKMHPCIGYVYFSLERLGAEVVAHEALHMAMWVERYVFKNKRAIFGGQIGFKEERLADMLTCFAARINEKFYSKGVYRV